MKPSCPHATYGASTGKVIPLQRQDPRGSTSLRILTYQWKCQTTSRTTWKKWWISSEALEPTRSANRHVSSQVFGCFAARMAVGRYSTGYVNSSFHPKTGWPPWISHWQPSYPKKTAPSIKLSWTRKWRCATRRVVEQQQTFRVAVENVERFQLEERQVARDVPARDEISKDKMDKNQENDMADETIRHRVNSTPTNPSPTPAGSSKLPKQTLIPS